MYYIDTACFLHPKTIKTPKRSMLLLHCVISHISKCCIWGCFNLLLMKADNFCFQEAAVG